MSYYISMVSSSVVLNKQDHKEIMRRWHKYCQPEKYRNEVEKQKKLQKLFSSKAAIKLHDYDNRFNKPEDFLTLLGFNYRILPNQDILIESYENKLTSLIPTFLELIIDLIEPGSKFEWRGEDGLIFYWCFNGNKIEELEYKDYQKIKKEERSLEILAEELENFFDAPKQEKIKELLPKEKPNRYKHML